MEFREISAADVPALFRVRTRTRENAYTLEELARLGITAESVRQRLASSCSGWLCEQSDTVVGFCMADGDSGELWVIAVLPEFEGRGIGGRLMALAERWLWEVGCSRAWLTTDVDTTLRAYGFYRHRGWVDWKLEGGLRWMQRFAPDGLPRA
jgi:GNAT superfamily N-acetyltransferase